MKPRGAPPYRRESIENTSNPLPDPVPGEPYKYREVGKSPSGVAGSIIYISCRVMGEKRVQKGIAERVQVTTVTIRNRYKELVSNLDLILQI
jgi:hypothetical protein